MDLQEHLDRLRSAIRQGTFRSEAAVSQGVVLPILNALGWPVFNTAVVTPEFSLEGRRVDFALCHPENQPAVFVEVKQVGMLEGADRQLLSRSSKYNSFVGIRRRSIKREVSFPAERWNGEQVRDYCLCRCCAAGAGVMGTRALLGPWLRRDDGRGRGRPETPS